MSSAFQSYSHNDIDEEFEGNEIGDWPKLFNLKLIKRIKQISPNLPFHIFFDRRENDINELSEAIKTNIDNAKILIIITSPSYFYSTWCRLEREYFLQHNKKERIFNIVKLPPPNGFTLPEDLLGSREYEFYEKDKHALEYYPNEKKYNYVLNQLAHNLIERFTSETDSDSSNGKSVFLNSNFSTSATSIYVFLENELKSRGITVVSGLNQKNDPVLQRNFLKEQLNNVLISLHIIGRNNEEADLLEIETAREVSMEKKLKIMIWISNEVDTSSNLYKRLNDESFITDSMDIFSGNFDQFKSNVIDQVNSFSHE